MFIRINGNSNAIRDKPWADDACPMIRAVVSFSGTFFCNEVAQSWVSAQVRFEK